MRLLLCSSLLDVGERLIANVNSGCMTCFGNCVPADRTIITLVAQPFDVFQIFVIDQDTNIEFKSRLSHISRLRRHCNLTH